MIAFADSSALVTHYAPSEATVLPNDATLVVSALARVEVVSALWQKAELGELNVAEAGALIGTFEADWLGVPPGAPRYRFVEVGAAILVRAAGATGTHRLRSLDAIQLACALAAREAEPDCRTMVVLDERLRRAAALERFELLPV